MPILRNMEPLKVKIPRKYHNYEALASQDAKRRRDEENNEKQRSHMKSPTNIKELQLKNNLGTVSRKKKQKKKQKTKNTHTKKKKKKKH